jgi:hypothetical protein
VVEVAGVVGLAEVVRVERVVRVADVELAGVAGAAEVADVAAVAGLARRAPLLATPAPVAGTDEDGAPPPSPRAAVVSDPVALVASDAWPR